MLLRYIYVQICRCRIYCIQNQIGKKKTFQKQKQDFITFYFEIKVALSLQSQMPEKKYYKNNKKFS